MPIAPRAKMPFRLLCVAGAAVAVMSLSACDTAAGPAPAGDTEARQVTVVGEGQVQGTPDTVTVNASIEFVAVDVTGAMNQTSDRTEGVVNALTNAGIDRSNITTSQITLQQQYSPDGSSIVGYRATNTLSVKIRPVDGAGPAIALIVSTGGDATRINSVGLSIDDDSQFIRDARSRAFGDARDRAEQYAQLSGLSLGNVISISESAATTPPTPLPGPMRAEVSSVPIEPGQQNVGFSVTVVWELT
jgi:uncharacterized protein YggE